MTESLRKLLIELEGKNSDEILTKLYEENDNARVKKNRRLSEDLNNLIFMLLNPGIKPGGVKEEDLEAFKRFQNSIKNN